MKTLISTLCLCGAVTLPADAQLVPSPGPLAPTTNYSIMERGPNHRTWGTVSYATNKLGRVSARTNSYVELATGMHFLQNGAWAETREQIELLPGGMGAAATNGPHQLYCPADIYEGAIEMVSPDGRRLRSRPWGISYFDGTNNVLVAELKPSLGQLLPSGNQVIYTNCFTDIAADVVVTYRRAGVECDLVFRQPPPPPEVFQLDPALSRMQLLTEWFDSPDPEKKSLKTNPADGLTDAVLDFGGLKLVPGKAFSIGDRPTPPPGQPSARNGQGRRPGIPVYKSWEKTADERKFLIEELPYRRIKPQLDQLSAVSKPGGYLAAGESLRHRVSAARLVPPARPVRSSAKTLQLVRADLSQKPGVVLDYVGISGTINQGRSFTFRGDTTYYVSGPCDLDGTTTIEGGTVIKFAREACLDIYGEVVCQTGPYRPAVLTAMDDNSVGEVISGSTGQPSGFYASAAIAMDGWSSKPLEYLKIAYAESGLYLMGDAIPVRHCQFLNLDTAIVDWYGQLAVENSLFENVRCGFWHFYASSASHLTAHNVGTLIANGSPSMLLSATNSLFIGVTNWGVGFVGCNNATNSSDAGVFQSLGAGSHYLADNSPYRNAGTTNINGTLLAALRKKTTHPPLLLSNVTVSAPLTLSPQAQRDTDLPDLGWHYDPIDYMTYFLTVTNAPLTITNGAVIGCYDWTGISLTDNSPVVSEGRPEAPNRFVDYRTVQEQSLKLGTGTAMPISPYRHNHLGAPGRFRFTDFSRLAGQNGNHFYMDGSTWRYSSLDIRDCTFKNGSCQFEEDASFRFGLTNNLFEGANLWVSGGFDFGAFNNLFRANSLTFECYRPTPWTIRDNSFDSGYVEDWGNVGVAHDHNIFINETVALYTALDASDLVLTNFSYVSGPLGNYYQVSTNLVDKGSQLAGLAGLYHYTTTTNLVNGLQVKELTSQVDIGFHYVAMDAQGNPIDTDGDGLRDYWEDTNGDGNETNDATSWKGYNSPNGLQSGSGLQVFTPLK